MPYRIAHVVTGLPIEGPFDYQIPDTLKEKIFIGQRVRVPFHMAQRVGFVVGFADQSKFKILKPILEILENNPSLDEHAMQLTKAFSENYGCSWGEAIEASLPTSLRKPKVIQIAVRDLPKPESIKADRIFLHDPSGQERWAHLISHIDRARQQNRGVLILVPEVSDIERVMGKLKEKFDETITILDKQLKPAEELDRWLMVKEGRNRIVVGTRSAIFAPLPNLGLIILEDENNSAYKQEQSPFYHTRDIAWMRADLEQCHLIFTAAAPSAELWHWAKKKKLQKVDLPSPTKNQVQLIDMSNYNPGKTSIVSFPLRNIIEKTLSEGGKIVLLINRKGFSSMTRCNQCGFTLKCPRCDVNLTYLYSQKKLVCRRCNFMTDPPKVCPQCNSSYLRYLGTGIEKLESDLARIFPQARLTHFEKETKTIPQYADIVIATEAVVDILPQLSAQVVAVLQFDTFLHRMDFRSAQTAFSLLMSLRPYARQKLIVQSQDIDNYALKALQKNNFEYFYRQELKHRRELDLPPFKHLAEIVLRGPKEEAILAQADELYKRLTEKNVKGLEILEPQPDVQAKLRDQYRFTIMMKASKTITILKHLKTILKDFRRKGNVIITVNIDP